MRAYLAALDGITGTFTGTVATISKPFASRYRAEGGKRCTARRILLKDIKMASEELCDHLWTSEEDAYKFKTIPFGSRVRFRATVAPYRKRGALEYAFCRIDGISVIGNREGHCDRRRMEGAGRGRSRRID